MADLAGSSAADTTVAPSSSMSAGSGATTATRGDSVRGVRTTKYTQAAASLCLCS
jgi:hypothetical protein